MCVLGGGGGGEAKNTFFSVTPFNFQKSGRAIVLSAVTSPSPSLGFVFKCYQLENSFSYRSRHKKSKSNFMFVYSNLITTLAFGKRLRIVEIVTLLTASLACTEFYRPKPGAVRSLFTD